LRAENLYHSAGFFGYAARKGNYFQQAGFSSQINLLLVANFAGDGCRRTVFVLRNANADLLIFKYFDKAASRRFANLFPCGISPESAGRKTGLEICRPHQSQRQNRIAARPKLSP
jgi:hypothetical protein